MCTSIFLSHAFFAAADLGVENGGRALESQGAGGAIFCLSQLLYFDGRWSR